MLSTIDMESGPETRIMPIAPPCAVAIAQMVDWFIIYGNLYYACSFLPNDGSILRREVTANVTLQKAMTIRKNVL